MCLQLLNSVDQSGTLVVGGRRLAEAMLDGEELPLDLCTCMRDGLPK